MLWIGTLFNQQAIHKNPQIFQPGWREYLGKFQSRNRIQTESRKCWENVQMCRLVRVTIQSSQGKLIPSQVECDQWHPDWDPGRNKVVISVHQVPGIDSLKSIPGLLKSLKMPSLQVSAEENCNVHNVGYRKSESKAKVREYLFEDFFVAHLNFVFFYNEIWIPC